MPPTYFLAPRRSRAGSTLVEVSVSIAMVGLFVSALMMMGSNVLGLLRGARDNISASHALQERVESMRIANWLQVTDANYLNDTFMGANGESTKGLAGRIETVTVTAYRAGIMDPAVRTQVVRENNATRIVVASAAIKDERMVRVDISLKWLGYPKKRIRERATIALIAKGGITK